MHSKDKSTPTKTILVIVVGIMIIHLITKTQWIIWTSLIIGLAGILSNYLSKKIDFLWMKLALLLSFIVPNILLSIIFYFLLTPIAFLSKFFEKKNQLLLKNVNSTFKKSNKKFNEDSFKNPW